MPAYLDTSAFVKLIRSEPESDALRSALSTSELVSSALLTLEGLRAAARYDKLAVERAGIALAAITLLPIDEAILDAAAQLHPPALRSLDALHLATAQSLAGELDTLYCYDKRLAHAARTLGLPIAQHPVPR